MTTEIINNLFGIKESFELPQALLAKLLDKVEKDKLCKEFVKQGFNGNNDCLRDYFQENNANRNNLKQDYTPDCLCKLISNLAPKSDPRFEGYDLAPAKASDYAFVLDGLSRLSDVGKAFYILPTGVLFRGNAEGRIRKQLIENNLIDAVISLPENLFLNTCIPVNVIVFSKNKQTRDILFISAEKLFEKHGKQNVMTDEHIQKIADAYHSRSVVEKFSNVASYEEIAKNDYNLNIPRYVDTFEKEELPSLKDLCKELIQSELEVRKATNDLMATLKDLCGDDEYNQVKDDFLKFFTEQDIVGETMATWLEMKNLENRTDYILSHAKKERKPLLDIVTFERVKKGKVYEAGTVYIQLSATDGKVRYLCENSELETKYGVFQPKDKSMGTRYLFYILEYEMEAFLARYQSGMNINPEIFKFMQVTYYPEVKYQQEIAMTLDGIQARYDEVYQEKESWQCFKKYHLEGMFP